MSRSTDVEMMLEDVFVFDAGKLRAIAEAERAQFRQAQPFPHAVIDGLLPEGVLRQVVEEFPAPQRVEWARFEDSEQKKLAAREEEVMGPVTRLLLYQLNSASFLEFLEILTGIEGLIPDPYYGGGGLHQIERGGYLEVHADFNQHPKLRLDRRLNVLVYLNENWEEEYGGHLELWNREMTRCERRVSPLFNRCVVFETTDFSYHGHPEPLACPKDRSRKSLALYYYTNGRPEHERSDLHTTLFQQRPGVHKPVEGRFERVLKRLLPPILLDLWGRLTHRDGR